MKELALDDLEELKLGETCLTIAKEKLEGLPGQHQKLFSSLLLLKNLR